MVNKALTSDRRGKMTGMERDPTGGGERIRGDEPDAGGLRHRARYLAAAEWIVANSPARRPVSILDFGCGTGYGSRLMEDHCDRFVVDGYDTQTRPWIGSPIATWDAIVALEVLEHMDDLPMSNFRRLMRRAPLVYASVPFMEPAGENKFHKHANLGRGSFPSACRAWLQMKHTGAIVDYAVAHERLAQTIIVAVKQ